MTWKYGCRGRQRTGRSVLVRISRTSKHAARRSVIAKKRRENRFSFTRSTARAWRWAELSSLFWRIISKRMEGCLYLTCCVLTWAVWKKLGDPRLPQASSNGGSTGVLFVPAHDSVILKPLDLI